MNRFRRPHGGNCFPGYRWCGPGCSGPGAPTNEVDSCCKAHDECYRRFGPSRYCDQLFQNCLLPRINRHNQMGRDAELFYKAMRVPRVFR
ncbi:Parvovirus coat protein VP1-like protein [Sutcliffiella rhizosphaerae]|uniref:Parvovirus coat protein VP1-like protein n=1 Tax=Sutcliffiella rhizosphaerae TaxID=2880967 RepID=UPI001E458571|nr:Parvovirus coat protein VP1-like protein [Sutcliffiella rhizosphaerae]